jgi:hypothetical protein
MQHDAPSSRSYRQRSDAPQNVDRDKIPRWCSNRQSPGRTTLSAPAMTHRQAIGALGRRRITVLWTMIQNRQVYRIRPVATA